MITERDIKALSLLHEFHFLTIEQLALCLYGNRVVVQRRLQSMEKEALVFSIPMMDGKRGKPTKLYYLNGRRQSYLEEIMGCSLSTQNLYKDPPLNLLVPRHQAELNEVLVRLYAGSILKGYQFSFIPEYYKQGKKNVLDRSVILGKEVRYRRDAVCCVSSSRSSALFEIEYDRGNEALVGSRHRKITIENKLRTFVQSVKERQFESYNEVFNSSFSVSRMVLVTSSRERIENISRLCDQLETKGLVYLAVLEAMVPESIFDAGWMVPPDKNLKGLGQ